LDRLLEQIVLRVGHKSSSFSLGSLFEAACPYCDNAHGEACEDDNGPKKDVPADVPLSVATSLVVVAVTLSTARVEVKCTSVKLTSHFLIITSNNLVDF